MAFSLRKKYLRKMKLHFTVGLFTVKYEIALLKLDNQKSCIVGIGNKKVKD